MAARAASGERKRNNGRRSGVLESARDFVPPHSALAQVVANQYGIDLRSVSPSPSRNGTGCKITAEDVEYHAWTLAQPPSAPEVLERAHSLGSDLNDLYDDEDREYVMNLEDVRLSDEDVRSLKMSSQTMKEKEACDSGVDARRRAQKMSALNERIERNTKKLFKRTGGNMYKLSKRAMRLAGTVTGVIVQQVQQSVRLNADVPNDNIALVDMNTTGKQKRDSVRRSGVLESVRDFVPPHSALAQVVANQYGIDLRSVSPSPNRNGTGYKITAEDVEYHAWTLAQPPSTPEVLKWADSLGLDLNDLYDDEDREYVMNLEDVRLYEENMRSLKMSSQTMKKKEVCDSDVNTRRRAKKMRALNERIERNTKKLFERTGRNMYKLSKRAMMLAGAVTGGIMQQVQQYVRLNADVPNDDIALVDMNKEVSGDTKAVEHVDAAIGSQNPDALLKSVHMDDNSTKDVPLEAKEGESSPSPMNGDVSGDAQTVEDMDADLGTQIADALSRSVDMDDNSTEDVPVETKEEESSPSLMSGEVSGDSKTVENVHADLGSQVADAPSSVNLDENNAEDVPAGLEEEDSSPLSSFTREELQTMTVVELKERLRGRGMKVSGRKAELVDRLLDGSNEFVLAG